MTPLIILFPSILGLGQASGCVREVRTDYPEGDIDGGVEGIGSDADGDCAERCFDEPKYHYWSYSHKDKKCWRKATKGKNNNTVRTNPDRISGNRDCGNIGDTNDSGDNKDKDDK